MTVAIPVAHHRRRADVAVHKRPFARRVTQPVAVQVEPPLRERRTIGANFGMQVAVPITDDWHLAGPAKYKCRIVRQPVTVQVQLPRSGGGSVDADFETANSIPVANDWDVTRRTVEELRFLENAVTIRVNDPLAVEEHGQIAP